MDELNDKSAMGSPENSASNVVPMQPRLSAEESRKLIRETREMVADRLVGTLRASLEKLEEELYALAEKATGNQQSEYLDARSEAKNNRDKIEKRFRESFLRLFDEKVAGGSSSAKAEKDALAELELSLVEEDDLESSLAVKNIAKKLINVTESELTPFAKRMAFLLNKEDLKLEDSPGNPEAVAESLQHALDVMHTASPKLRLAIMKLLEQFLANEMRSVYGETNGYLVQRQVLPQIRTNYRRPVSLGGRPGLPATSGAAAPAGDATADLAAGLPPAEADIFAQLQALMMGQAQSVPTMPTMGMPGAPGVPGMPNMANALGSMGAFGAFAGLMPAGGIASNSANILPPMAPIMANTPMVNMPAGGFLSALNGLQQGSNFDFWSGIGLDAGLLGSGVVPQVAQVPMGLPEGIDPNSIEGQAALVAAASAAAMPQPMTFVNVARQIRTSAVGQQMDQNEGVTTDIVAMIFDYVFEDSDIPDPIKAIVSKLQVPVLKVAIVDKGFFTQKDHPVRLFLDRLAEVSIGCPATVAPEDELYQKIESVVNRVLTEYDTDVAIFTRELHDLERFHNDYLEKQRAFEEETARMAEARERNDAIRYSIEIETSTRALNPAVPVIVQALISEALPPLLMTAYKGDDGLGGEGGEAWNDVLKLADDLIWSVQPKDNSDERKQLTSMLPSLLKRLKISMGQAGMDNEKSNAFLRSLAGLHASAVKNEVTAAGPSSAVDVDLSDAPPEIRSSHVSTSSGLAVEEIRLVKQSREIKAALDKVDEFDQIAKNLKRGTWAQFKRSDGGHIRAKLTYTSPEYGVYVFTNPQLENALSISREALIVQLRMGEIEIVPERSLFDRAVGGLMSKLKGSRTETVH